MHEEFCKELTIVAVESPTLLMVPMFISPAQK
jgi:hypothetical protein